MTLSLHGRAVTLVATAWIAGASFAQPETTISCIGVPNPMSCAAYQSKAESLRSLATSNRKQWERVAFLFTENAPPPFLFLPNGAVLEMSTGQVRQSTLSAYSSSESTAKSAKAVAQRRTYLETLFYFHSRGILTYDAYPCSQTCEGHEQGFKWAEEKKVTEYAACNGGSQSFSEGCFVYVTRSKGNILRERDER